VQHKKIGKKKHWYNHAAIFFHFCDIKNLEKMNKKLENLVEFTLGKQKFLKFSQFLCQKMAAFCQKQALQSCKQIIPGANSYFLILYHGLFGRIWRNLL
jgi:hypothetical protein